MIKKGDIALTILPQDGTQKRRPVLVLSKMPGFYDDFLVCAISSQLQQFIDGFDLIIHKSDSVFKIQGYCKVVLCVWVV
jgi:mRNA interferase MazF